MEPIEPLGFARRVDTAVRIIATTDDNRCHDRFARGGVIAVYAFGFRPFFERTEFDHFDALQDERQNTRHNFLLMEVVFSIA